METTSLLFRVLKTALVLAALLGALSWAGCAFYRASLFPREPATLDQARAAAERHALRLWPQDGPDYLGLVSRAPPARHKGVVVVFHGNAGLASGRFYYRDALEPLGWRVVLAEYPGYGARPGTPGETLLTRDGLRAVAAARAKFGDPLYIWGESLGAAVASAVAAEPDARAAGLILLTPWDALVDLAAHFYPGLPVRLFVRDHFDNGANLTRYGGRTAFILAGRDEVIPTTHSRRLHDGYAGPKQLWEFPESGHNTWPANPALPWWREVVAFMETPATP